MQIQKQNYTSKILVPVLIFFLIGGIVIALDGREFWRVLQKADWIFLLPALIFTSISYFSVSYTYAIISRVMGIRVNNRNLTEICFISTVINHIIRSGGVAGLSVRYMLMKRFGVKLNDVVSTSLVHQYLTSLDMLAMLPVGIAYLIWNTDVPPNIHLTLSALTIVFALFAVIATLLVFNTELRVRLIDFISRVIRKISRRDFSSGLHDFHTRMTKGINRLRKKPAKSWLVIAITFIDWIASVIVLGLCYAAFGNPLPPGAVIACFVIGIMAGVASAIPGGIGVQEGFMTGIAMLLGATFAQAFLASILFRIIYYFIPYLIIPLFYWRQVRQPALQYSD